MLIAPQELDPWIAHVSGALLAGGYLVAADPAKDDLSSVIERFGVTHAFFPAALIDAIASYDRFDALTDVEVRTSVVAAEKDHVGTPEEMRAIATTIPDASFEVVPNASHMSQFLHPNELARRLISAADGDRDP